MYKLKPEGSTRTYIYTDSDALATARKAWRRIEADRREPDSMRRAATRLLNARVEWGEVAIWYEVDE